MYLWKYMVIIFAFGAVGGLLVGVGGARWLSNEVDKKLLRAAASKAASGQPDDQKAIRISAAPPAEALRIAAE